VIAPFLRIGLWSVILAVAFYPLLNWLAERLHPLGCIAVTLLCLMIVVGPVTWWGLATTNMKVALAEVAPMLKPVVFTQGPQLVDALSAFLGRLLSHLGRSGAAGGLNHTQRIARRR
jgi:predicted PurR-regulated permease PerM